MTDPLLLDDDLTAVTKDQWLRAVRGVVLKGKPDASDEEFAAAFAKQLVTRTEDGLEIQPLYDAADAPTPSGLPGFAPFVRAAHAAPVPWEVRQRVWASVDGSSAVTELESGATGVLLELAGPSELAAALQGVLLDVAPVSLTVPTFDAALATAGALLDAWEQADIAAEDRRGTLGLDPIGTWARTGGAFDLPTALGQLGSFVATSVVRAPLSHAVVVDATVWHDAGASDAQEIGWAAAVGATYVRTLVDAGVDVREAAGQLEFRMAATADQFATIAKLRAARRIWARVLEIAGLAPADRRMYQHADGSRVMLTRYDPWVNTLRSTVACFAAGMAGADAVTISPHDVLRIRGGSKLGRRVARNTQSVLQAESNLSRVVDPAGGSWYVERRTEDLAAVAWDALAAAEAAGGIAAALADGAVHAALSATLAERKRRLATRRRPLTGLSEFPDIDEVPPPPLDEPAVPADAAFEPLRLHRLAEDFERQRGRADVHAQATGARPQVVLATLGTPAVHTARATFAKNLFEAGGIRTVAIDLAGYDAAVSPVVCLCSSDAIYGEQGAAAVTALRDAGASAVYVAGRNLDLAGVDEEVGVGSDVLEVLTRALDRLGVPAAPAAATSREHP